MSKNCLGRSSIKSLKSRLEMVEYSRGNISWISTAFASHIHWWKSGRERKSLSKKNQQTNKPIKQTNKAKGIGTTSCQNIFDNTEKTFQWHLLPIFKCNDAMLFWNLLWASIVNTVLATMLAPSFFFVCDFYLSWEEADCHSDNNTAWKLFHLKNLNHLSALRCYKDITIMKCYLVSALSCSTAPKRPIWSCTEVRQAQCTRK